MSQEAPPLRSCSQKMQRRKLARDVQKRSPTKDSAGSCVSGRTRGWFRASHRPLRFHPQKSFTLHAYGRSMTHERQLRGSLEHST